jgi:hypothetical protein
MWAELHQEELLENWQRAMEQRVATWIVFSHGEKGG